MVADICLFYPWSRIRFTEKYLFAFTYRTEYLFIFTILQCLLLTQGKMYDFLNDLTMYWCIKVPNIGPSGISYVILEDILIFIWHLVKKSDLSEYVEPVHWNYYVLLNGETEFTGIIQVVSQMGVLTLNLMLDGLWYVVLPYLYTHFYTTVNFW